MSRKVVSKRTVTIGGVEEEIELSISELLSHVEIEDCISYFGEDSILDEIDTPEIIKHFKTEELLEEIGVVESVKHFGEDKVLEEIDIDLILNNIAISEFIDHKGTEEVLNQIEPEEALCWALKNDLTVTKDVLMRSLSSYYSYPELLKIFLGAIKLKEFKEE